MTAVSYQLLDRLRAEEAAALEADIRRRQRVMIPVELDEDGNILDGHHRAEIADRLGIPYDTVTRHFDSEQEKREYVIKINLCRRHLDPVQWGQAFAQLLEVRGVKRGQGARNDNGTSATVAEVAAELGVSERTARWRLRQADRPAEESVPPSLRPDRACVSLPAAMRNVIRPCNHRWAIGCVEVRPSAGEGLPWITATNGRIAVVRKVEGFVDRPRLIPLESLPTRGQHVILLDELPTSPPPPSVDDFPPVASVMPEVDDSMRAVTLNARLLYRLACSLGPSHDDGVMTLFFPKDNRKPIGVLGPSGIGAIMPCLGDGDGAAQYTATRNEYLRTFGEPPPERSRLATSRPDADAVAIARQRIRDGAVEVARVEGELSDYPSWSRRRRSRSETPTAPRCSSVNIASPPGARGPDVPESSGRTPRPVLEEPVGPDDGRIGRGAAP